MSDRKRMLASAGPRLALIAESFAQLSGQNLVDPGSDLETAMWQAPRAIVAHGTEAVPRIFYGNRQTLELFAMNAEQFIGLPSQNSVEPALREERASLFSRLEHEDIIANYSGVRIAADGRRFRIERAFVWNILDSDGNHHGQAATFADWNYL